uniref:BSD domain containing 1 n=1 Tax=Astyanax mexicanus TaxID=7994 RepID=A0A8B9J3W4_ASTMX
MCFHREGGWWGGWLQQSYQVIKDRSSEAYEFLKRDLTEFSNVVQHDTACSIVATASAVKNKLAVEGSSETTEKVKKSISNILGVITDTLAPPPDMTIDCDVITLVATPAGTTEVYDSSKVRLEFLHDWLKNFTVMYVPAAVAHSEFWQRYFYKVFQLDQEEARRVALKRRAEETSQSESLGWEEEEEGVFLGATSMSRLDFTPPLEESALPTVTIETPSASAVSPVDVMSDVTPSVSSDSISLPTQLENHPEQSVSAKRPTPTEEVTLKLSEARLEAAEEKQAAPTREDGPQDLRVFELNSDSGKSTPSNNGKKGSSTDVSEDWEKDFDLDMTEEEVQMALSKADATGEVPLLPSINNYNN